LEVFFRSHYQYHNTILCICICIRIHSLLRHIKNSVITATTTTNIHNNNPPATDQRTTPPTTANMQFKLSFQISLLAIAISKCMAPPIPASSITSDAAGRDIVVRKGCSPPRPTTYCSKWDKDLDHCVQWNDEQTTKPTLSERDVTQVDISGGETGRDTIEVDATKVDAPKVDNTKGDTTKADSHKKLTCDNCFPYFSVSIL
jgi:hypothetical protein